MKVAIIVPRYGPDVLGGAESQARSFAEEATRRDWEVEVWTTCARSHYTWENTYPAGHAQIQGVVIRRFPVTSWNPTSHAELNTRLASQGTLSADDQFRWLESGAHSAPLYAYAAHHATEFDATIVLPYAMPLTHYAAWAAPENTVVWPCLHNEPYAYIEPTRLLLENVWGVMFNSPEESNLALGSLKIRPIHSAVLGEGVNLIPIADAPSQDSNAYLLYMGRLESGKNLALLYDYVQRYFAQDGGTRLVVLGGGPAKPPQHPAFEYRGFVSEEEKAHACASALALCQPSLNESFSLTIMESWLAGRPVIVHGECVVTRGHARRSKGGLWFCTYDEFIGAIEWLRDNPALATQMGKNGRRYVLSNYSWKVIVGRFERLIRRWKGEDE